MDKHNRPYICEEPECENISGFTYSGGLLRHQREVHRQHGGPKASCMCPYPDCKRHTGVGFSRRENLQEHIRRCHRDTGVDKKRTTASTAASQQAISASQEILVGDTRKRRRRAPRADDEGGDEEGEAEDSKTLQQEVKKLRKELAQKDERLTKLEQMVEQLARSQR